MFDWLTPAGPAAAGAPAAGAPLMTQYAILFIVLFGVWYVMLIRPQRKKQQEHQQLLMQLKKGDKIVTIGGLHGVVHSVKEQRVVLKVDDNCKLEYSLSAVAQVNPEAKPADKDDKGK